MTHFALSELLIVVVGLWAARRLYGAQRSAAALALAHADSTAHYMSALIYFLPAE